MIRLFPLYCDIEAQARMLLLIRPGEKLACGADLWPAAGEGLRLTKPLDPAPLGFDDCLEVLLRRVVVPEEHGKLVHLTSMDRQQGQEKCMHFERPRRWLTQTETDLCLLGLRLDVNMQPLAKVALEMHNIQAMLPAQVLQELSLLLVQLQLLGDSARSELGVQKRFY